MRLILSLVTLLSITIAASLNVQAGQLLLNNGDLLNGQLGLIDKTNVTWNSENFGTLSINKNNVADISVDQPVVIRGQRDPCNIVGMDRHYLAYRCGKSSYVQRTELLALALVEPFVEDREKTYEYGGQMTVAGVFSRGNTIKDDLDVLASSTYRQGNFRHSTIFDISSLSSADAPKTEDYEANYRLDWFFDERWFWYNSLAAGSTESKNIEEFYNYGTGLGVQMWQNINSALALESGLDYIKEHFELPDSDDNEAAVWRFATRFRYTLPWLSARLVHNNEVLYSLADGDDWELAADLGLSVPLGQGLYSDYKIEYDYDNQPAEGIKRDDTKFTIGIGYQW